VCKISNILAHSGINLKKNFKRLPATINCHLFNRNSLALYSFNEAAEAPTIRQFYIIYVKQSITFIHYRFILPGKQP
jgi:hypothetical protein